MNMRFLFLLMIVVLAFSAGCRTGRVSDMTTPAGSSAVAIDKELFTVQDMREAIVKGCAERNWRVVEKDANTIEATNVVRNKHTVVVSIPYTETSYTINYKDSTNMNYRPKSDGTFSIHPNYNNWVNNLDQSIQKQISLKKK